MMAKHVTIDNIMEWIAPVPSSNTLILEELADKIADLLNGTYTIAQLRNAILNDKREAIAANALAETEKPPA